MGKDAINDSKTELTKKKNNNNRDSAPLKSTKIHKLLCNFFFTEKSYEKL